MNGTTIQQGRFTSTAEEKTLVVRSDMDWIQTYNLTAAGLQKGVGRPIKLFWQRGMAADSAITFKKQALVDTIEMTALTTGGFTLVDTSKSQLGALDSTVTAVSADAVPEVTLTSTLGIESGDIVRMYNIVGAKQLGGYDFTAAPSGATTFELAYMAQIVAGTTGAMRVIKNEESFYPHHRFISKITQAESAVVTMTVTHKYTVGQKIRFAIPDDFGMTQLNGLVATITAVSTDLLTNVNTITVNVDTRSFTAFAFPLTAVSPFSPALVIPFGMGEGADYANLLTDATRDTGFIGVRLGASDTFQSAVGETGDVIYWTAGKSFSVSNT